jgi:hypothetical protein
VKKRSGVFLILLGFIISCSDEASDALEPKNETMITYYGTYLYEDIQCSGSDIQYATIHSEGITFYDYLGDDCDDTVECYISHSYELAVLTNDTLLIMAEGNVEMTNGIVFMASDSVLNISYDGIDGYEEYNWKKVGDDISTFTPICDQEYENTKDIADIMVYAVSDDGGLLWKNYIHDGIWDLGSSITQTQDGGYLILGEFDGVSWGGCCYSYDPDKRDIIKLDDKGEVQWRKEIVYADYGIMDSYIVMAKSLFETPQGDLVFIAQTQIGMGLTIVMMDQEGELLWSSEIPDVYNWSNHAEIILNSNGDIALVSGPSPSKLTLIDYSNGHMISQTEYPELGYPKAIISVGLNMIIAGQTEEIDSLDYEPIFLLKTGNIGQEIWRKIWDQEVEKMFGVLDVLETNDGGFMIFCETDPAPYATLIKTDDEGNEEWRRKYDDYVGGGQGWIHQTDDGGFFMATGYAVTKLNPLGYVEWNAACSSCFQKEFNNGIVSGINHDMKPIQGGAVMVGYGSQDWE